MQIEWYGGPEDGEVFALPDYATHVVWTEARYRGNGLFQPTLLSESIWETLIYEHPSRGHLVVNYHYRQPSE